MNEIAIVIAESEGGLDAALGQGFAILQGTKRQFSGLTTFADDALAEDVQLIDTAKSGWIALAKKQHS